MFDWLSPNRVTEVMPDALREFIEPLKRKLRDEQVAECLRISREIEGIEKQLAEVVLKEQAAKAKRVEIEAAHAAIRRDLAAIQSDEDTRHWEAFDLRGRIQILNDQKARAEREIAKAR